MLNFGDIITLVKIDHIWIAPSLIKYDDDDDDDADNNNLSSVLTMLVATYRWYPTTI
jgi:hypothetical protein